MTVGLDNSNGFWRGLLDRALRFADQRQGASPLAPENPVSEPAGRQPAVIEAKDARGDTSIYGVPATAITGGFLVDLGEYNAALMGRTAVSTYEKMRRGDAQVEATLEACIQPILSAQWDVTPADGDDSSLAKEIAEEFRENLIGGLETRTESGNWESQAWSEVLRNCLLMLPLGCSAYEEVWTVDGSQLRLRMLADLPPASFYQWDVEPDGRTLRGIVQYGYRGNQFLRLEVPAEKIALFTFRKEGANFWGRPLLRAAYPHWYVKNALYRIDALAGERNGLGVPCITLPQSVSKDDRDLAVQYVTQLAAHEKTGLALPAGATFKIHGVEGLVRDLQPSIAHHNEQIAMVALAAFLNLARGASGASGNRAVGQTQTQFFLLALQNVADYIAQRISNTTARRWTYFNYGPDAPVPRLRAANVQARSFETVMDYLVKLAQGGVFKADLPARNKVRTELGFEEETDEGIEPPVVPGSLADPEPPQEDDAEEQDAQLASDLAPQVRRTRDQASPFWPAPVATSELHVNFSEIDREFSRSEAVIGRTLRDWKKTVMRQAANQLSKKLKRAGYRPSDFGLTPDAELEQAVERQVAKTYQFGRGQVRDEHQRLTQSDKQQLADAPKLSRLSNRYQTIAEITVEDFTNRISVAAQNAANDLRRSADFETMSAGEIADELFGALDGLSEGFIDRAAQEASRSAMGAGRGDELEALKADLGGLRGFWERTALLDKNTCNACESADGEQMAPGDGPPPDPWEICEGGPACRCQWIEVIP